MKKPSNRYRSLISIFMAAALIMSSGLICVQAADISGLDEYIALDMMGKTESSTAEASEDAAEPLLKAGPDTFAEAMAQEYRRLKGTYILSRDSRFYIVTE